MANPRITFDIAQGDEAWGAIVLELDAENAPTTTQNFLAYVASGFFEGTVFHRVIPGFMIQGGGYGVDSKPKRGELAPIQNEAANGLKNDRGTIAMARTADPHSATSQFFINVNNNDMLNHPAHDGWGYCVFGKVVEGMDVVDRIRDVETKFNPQMGENSQPTNPPIITSAKRLDA